MVKITTVCKTEIVPGTQREERLFTFTVEGIKITGRQMEKWFYNAKINGKKYHKLYLDLEAEVILGRKDEFSQWEEVVKIDEREAIKL